MVGGADGRHRSTLARLCAVGVDADKDRPQIPNPAVRGPKLTLSMVPSHTLAPRCLLTFLEASEPRLG